MKTNMSFSILLGSKGIPKLDAILRKSLFCTFNLVLVLVSPTNKKGKRAFL